jgi:hypothetical protein
VNLQFCSAVKRTEHQPEDNRMHMDLNDADDDTWLENLSPKDQAGCGVVSLVAFVFYVVFFVLKPMYWDEPEPPPEPPVYRNPYYDPDMPPEKQWTLHGPAKGNLDD